MSLWNGRYFTGARLIASRLNADLKHHGVEWALRSVAGLQPLYSLCVLTLINASARRVVGDQLWRQVAVTDIYAGCAGALVANDVFSNHFSEIVGALERSVVAAYTFGLHARASRWRSLSDIAVTSLLRDRLAVHDAMQHWPAHARRDLARRRRSRHA